MTNEYGVQLDRNGYAPSLMNTSSCVLCGMHTLELVRHEVYHGIAYREKSKALGTWVTLCPECHRVLHNKKAKYDLALKKKMQKIAMKEYGWSVDDFRARFFKNYLD